MIRDVKAAVIARLRTDTTLTVYDSEAPATVGQSYVVLYMNSGYRVSDRFTGPSNTALFTFTLHSVGLNPDQTQFVQERVLAKLVDWTPTVTGHNPQRMRHEVSLPARVDTDAATKRWFAVDQFDLLVS